MQARPGACDFRVKKKELPAYEGFLTEKQTGKIVKTSVTQAKFNEVKNLKRQRWNFNWEVPFVEGYEVYKITLVGENEIQGLIAFKSDISTKAVHVKICESAPDNIGSKGKYEGVGPHLFAIAAMKSIEYGYDGYLYFEAKSKLIKHYKRSIGAKQVGNSQVMIISPTEAKILINRYLERRL